MWLTDYIEYTKYQASPELFHFWVGLTTLAAVVNRRVWIDKRGQGVTWYKVYPGQMMTVLVAPSGKGHKSTAIRIGRRFMKESGVRIIKAKASTEKLIKVLAHHGQAQLVGTKISSQPDAIGVIIASELSVFLSKQVYAESLVDFLTEIFDAEDPFEYMTQKDNIITMRNPCVTFLAGATPVSIGESIPEKAHASGYTGRVLHIYHCGDGKATDPLCDLDDTDVSQSELDRRKLLEHSLTEELKLIGKIQGPFLYTRAARSWYKEWCARWEASPQGQGEGYPTRRPDHMLRIAMLLRLSEFQDRILDVPQLAAADAALKDIESGFVYAFSKIGHNQIAKHQDKILEHIRQAGGLATSADLYKTFYRVFNDIDALKKALQTLREAGEISVFYSGPLGNVETWRLPTTLNP